MILIIQNIQFGLYLCFSDSSKANLFLMPYDFKPI